MKNRLRLREASYWVASAWALSTCKEDSSKQTVDELAVHAHIHDVHIKRSEEGVVKLYIEAPVQQEYKNGDRSFPEGFSITYVKNEGTRVSTLKAKRGYYFDDKEIYKAEGAVRLHNLEKNTRLDTEALFWNPRTKKVYTDSTVYIESEDEIHKGRGLIASEDFSEYQMMQPEGTISVEEEEE